MSNLQSPLGRGLLALASAAVLAGAALAPRPAAAGSFLGDLVKLVSTYNEVNQVLMLLGDPASERRFGFLFSRFMMLTNPIDRDPERNRWVRKIFDKVVEPGRRRGFQYRIHVVRDKSVNAFALPGGYVFVNRGMLDFVRSDDELACVLGHELAHVNRRHVLQNLRQNVLFLALLEKVTKDDSDARTWSTISYLFLNQAFSRNHERESDRLGMEYARGAGYDPSGMATLWEHMLAKGKETRFFLAKWLTTHPGHQERVDNAKRLLAQWNLPFRETSFLTYNVHAAEPDELLDNGSFEDATDAGPAGFELGPGVVVDDAVANNGQRSLRCASFAGARECSFRSTPHPFDPKKTYVVSGALRGGAGRPNAWLGAEFYDRSGQPLGTIWAAADGANLSPDQWTTFTGELGPEAEPSRRAPEGAATLALAAVACRATEGQCWFDDVRLGFQGTGTAAPTVAEGPEPLPRSGGPALPSAVANGDFEADADKDGKPDRWFCSAGSTRATEGAARGAGCLLLEGAVEGRVEFAVSELLPVAPGGRYVLEGRVKADPAPAEVTFGCRWCAKDGRPLKESPPLPTVRLARGSRWALLEQRLEVPPESPCEFVQVTLRARPGKGQRLWADDVTLVPAGGAPPR